MKKILFMLFILLLISIANAQLIKVNIAEVLNGNITSLVYNPNMNTNLFKITTEFFNTGSIGYKARARLDIFSQSNLLYTAWSKEASLIPGVKSSFDMYWYEPNMTGNFSGRLRVYYANEIKESEIRFKIKNFTISQDIFEISDLRTYDNYIKFSLKSPQTLSNVIVFPSKYPLGWIFEQTKIEKLNQNDKISVALPYQPSLWIPNEVTIAVVTEDGKYYSSKTFTLVKEEGLLKYIHYLTDGLRVLLNI